MSLKNDSTLPVCPRCGWAMAGVHETRNHEASCDREEAGALALALAGRLPEVASTKFGYGSSALTFELDDEMHIRFKCHARDFDLSDVWLLTDLTPDAAADLVQTLVAWRARNPMKTPHGG